MHLPRFMLLLLVLVMVSAPARASQEGMLNFASFALKADGIDDSGPVEISGTQMKSGIASLRIRAFGKDFFLSPSHLKQLGGFGVNGLQVTYEHGYQELGGPTIYLALSAGFSSGVARHKFVVITESGSIKVTDKLY